MKERELDYFQIEDCLGGNQDWFHDYGLHKGGCAALTACDLALYLYTKGETRFYPFRSESLDKGQYLEFGHVMKPYLAPRNGGIKDLDIFVEGFSQYMKDRRAEGIELQKVAGEASWEEAREAIRSCLDLGLPVVYLQLHHKDASFVDYEWHWFLVIGYREEGENFEIKVVTYGEAAWLNLEKFWQTGYEEKGGIVLPSFANKGKTIP